MISLKLYFGPQGHHRSKWLISYVSPQLNDRISKTNNANSNLNQYKTLDQEACRVQMYPQDTTILGGSDLTKIAKVKPYQTSLKKYPNVIFSSISAQKSLKCPPNHIKNSR